MCQITRRRITVLGEPRKAVEVNALWVNALAVLSGLQTRSDEWASALERQARASFADRFPAPGGGLYDVVDSPDGDDATVRPNQLLAYSLPHAPLRDAGATSALAASLLTPPRSAQPRPGRTRLPGQASRRTAERDGAYHQGTVWPWLIGPWIDARLRAGARRSGDVLAGLDAHLGEWGLGSVSETADGDAPHAATGCPFQAWSVAELLRAHRSLAG